MHTKINTLKSHTNTQDNCIQIIGGFMSIIGMLSSIIVGELGNSIIGKNKSIMYQGLAHIATLGVAIGVAMARTPLFSNSWIQPCLVM